MHDIVVIGGGPAGSRAATLLSKTHDVTVLEDHAAPGLPIQCTGLVTKDVIRLSGVRPDILNTLYGANVHFPNGGVLSASSDRPKAVLIDRQDLDTRLVHVAQDAGAEYVFSERYTGHTVGGGSVDIRTASGTDYRSRLLIGADGHSSKVALSLDDNLPREYVRGIQVDIRHRMEDQRMIEIRVGSELAPGFFSWEIPFGDFTRVGLCTSWSAGPPADRLKSLLKRAGLQDAAVINKVSGKIPLGGRRTTYGDGVMLIGDAAGQVKPVSGGGLYPAFRAAPCLAETADAAFEANDFSARRLSRYEKGWRSEVGKELKRGYMLRRMYVKLSDDDIDRAYRAVDRDDVRSMLNNINIDSPSDMVPLMMRNIPVALKLMPIMLKALL